MASELEILIELLPWLVANNGASAKDVGDKFGITEAKVLDLMQLLVLTGPNQGGGGLVDIDFEDSESLFVFDSQDFDKPVRLTAFEANALLGGLHYLHQVVDSDLAITVSELISKISKAIPGANTPVEVVPITSDKDLLSLLQSAVTDRKVLKLKYASLTSDQVTSREIQPLAITAREDLIYVRAWCLETDDVRVFRTDRIIDISDTGTVFSVDNLNFDSSNPINIVAKLLATEKFTRELDPNLVVTKTAQAHDQILIEVSVHSFDWLAGLVLAAGGECRVEEPESLRKLVVTKASTWVK